MNEHSEELHSHQSLSRWLMVLQLKIDELVSFNSQTKAFELFSWLNQWPWEPCTLILSQPQCGCSVYLQPRDEAWILLYNNHVLRTGIKDGAGQAPGPRTHLTHVGIPQRASLTHYFVCKDGDGWPILFHECFSLIFLHTICEIYTN